ncbi:aspartate-alanine antiporter [Brevibacterium aurantiacum]|uniref:aspartate-alanine antiporter n=1 Tax=Brevibacterium aurantiacum TaxID=273384 RepID=UPI001ABF118A|nr:aspartate-alanine antiporter [Brevibacterium aurantiacum]
MSAVGAFLKDSIFADHPELLIFLVILFGFLIGRIRYKSIALGAVTGCLIVGLAFGSQIQVTIDDTVKNLFFTLFLFALGYKVGPQFFRGLRKDGLPQVLNAVVVAVTGLLVCWLFASLLGYGPGLSAGLLGGALTQSAVIGTAADAIGSLPGLSKEQISSESNLVAVGYAVCYPLGTILCASLLASILPRIYRRNLSEESAELEKELNTPSENPDFGTGYYETVLRAYSVGSSAEIVGQSIQSFEDQQNSRGRRIYLTRIRRDGVIIAHDQATVVREGDVIAVSGLHHDLVDYDPRKHIGTEIDDPGLLGYRTERISVVVSKKPELGKTIAELREQNTLVGVYIDKIYRSGEEFPFTLGTAVERGDTLVLSGPERLVSPAATVIGKPVPTSFATDMAWVSAGVVLGGLVGLLSVTIGGVPISLSTSGGALIMGLVFGWLRGKYPTFGNVPPGAQWLMDTLGLCLFVAVVGINAGPSFGEGLKSAGWGLLVFGAVATVIPLLVGFVFGFYVQKMRFPILMAVLAGGQTTTAAIGAINEASKSQIPTLGYTIPYAVSNVLLTIWGAVIVLLVH